MLLVRRFPPRLKALVLIWTIVSLSGYAHAAGARQFSDFPVTEIYAGEPADIDAGTAPENWSAVMPMIKEIILEEMAKGPNFAGAYHLTTVPCGSGCEAIFVIDLRNGRVYAAPEAASNGVLFQKDSRLIILKENPQYNQPRSYLVFHEGEFKKIE